MPRGELFVRTKRTMSGGGGWVDAFERYGASLEEGALMRLMGPVPKKAPTGQSDPGSHGVKYLGGTIGKTDERQLTLDLHITAPDRATYLTRYGAFCREVLDCQYLQLRTCYEPGKVYHLLYKHGEMVKQYLNGLGMFSVTFTEPHPEINDDRLTGFTNTTVE